MRSGVPHSRGKSQHPALANDHEYPRLVIIAGVRTPFCRAGTDLAALAAEELGRIAVDALLTRTGLDPALIDEVIFGCVAQPAETREYRPRHRAARRHSRAVPAVTVHRNCASGLEAITTAYERMCAGHGAVFLVGGTESMSRVPLLFREATAAQIRRARQGEIRRREKFSALSRLPASAISSRASASSSDSPIRSAA